MCVLAISVYVQRAAANSGNCQSAAVTGSEKGVQKAQGDSLPAWLFGNAVLWANTLSGPSYVL